MSRGNWTIGIIAIILLLFAGVYLLGINRGGANSSPTPIPTNPITKQSTTPTTASPSASPSTTPTAAVHQVILTADGFSPATLTIKAGDSVTWINQSGADATVNSNPHPTHTDYPPLNLGTFSNGASLSLTFPKKGTYGFHNHFDPSQKGTIIVE
jgi:plastocyanin